jgi:hypothetical protein
MGGVWSSKILDFWLPSLFSNSMRERTLENQISQKDYQLTRVQQNSTSQKSQKVEKL